MVFQPVQTMSFALTLLILTEAFGFCSLLANIRRAPEGYQDEVSFYFVTQW
jgi:hypothetical protein